MTRNRRGLTRAVLFGLLLCPLVARAADELPEVAEGAAEHMVAMRDDVKLATNVFLPEGEGPWPVILTRTPYSKDGRFGSRWMRYTAAGYAYVVQDTRGKFRSEGEYQPFVTDREDGFDTINWVAEQGWCNGKVGMSGGSAMGITSLLAAIADPENLVCAFVVVAPQSFWNESTFIGGVFKEADVGNWMRRQGAADQVPWRKGSIARHEEELGRDIIHHRHKIDIPIYHLGGWYDIFSVGTQGNFSYLHNNGRDGARGQQKLMMGPFGHGELVGDLEYVGSSGIRDVYAQQMRWFDYHLKGEDTGVMDEPAVSYYQMAAARKGDFSEKNEWRTAANWPLQGKETRFYLSNPHGLMTRVPESKKSSTTYKFDPASPVPTVGGPNLTLPIGPEDQRQIGEREDYFRFETPPLEEDLSIAGAVRLDLFASTDAPDTDFMCKLVDVYPDGYEALLLDAPLRTRYRDGRHPDSIKMMRSHEPTRLTVELGSIANTFEKGHRIAVHVTSSNFPRFEVNPNTGEAPGKSELKPRAANNTIHHDADHPTALVLPVID